MTSRHSISKWISHVVLATLWSAFGSAVAIAQLSNGDFETGLSGWNVANTTPSGSWLSQTGATVGAPGPITAVPAPPQGSFAAMTNQTGSGVHVLSQDFSIPLSFGTAILSFQYFIWNHADSFLRQQARVDFLPTSATAFSVAPADILMNVFITNVGDPLNTSAYIGFTSDVTAFMHAHSGETLRLRFAEADTQGFFNFGVDDVKLTFGAVPEPSAFGWLGGLLVLGAAAQRKIRATARAGRHAWRPAQSLRD